MTNPITAHLMVPVADETDARQTARVLADYDHDQVTVVHVIEKAGGVPDKIPLAEAERRASEAFAAFRQEFPDVETETIYDRDVVEAIFAAASDVDATAISFRPRGGNRLVQFLSGDRALRLVTNAPRPVVVLPEDGGTE